MSPIDAEPTPDRTDLVGMRDEDLTDDERARRDALVASDDEAAADALLAERLGGLAASMDGGPTLEAVRARAKAAPGAPAVPAAANRPRWGWAVGLAAAAVAVVAVAVGLPPDDQGRWKGAAGPATMRLEVAAEGADGLRPLAGGDAVAPRERVLFTVHVDRPGELSLHEGVGDVWAPVTDFGVVDAGAHVPGGQAPLSWRPDRRTGASAVRYRAVWCPVGQGGTDGAEVPSGCASVEETLHWAP